MDEKWVGLNILEMKLTILIHQLVGGLVQIAPLLFLESMSNSNKYG